MINEYISYFFNRKFLRQSFTPRRRPAILTRMRHPLAYSLILTLSLAACATRVQTLGFIPPPGWEEQVKVGQTTRDEARTLLGSPSTQSTFGQETWYYVSAQRRQFAFFRPSLHDEQVIRLTFDDSGKLAKMDKLTDKDARDITIASKETPTEGHEMGFMEQMFGNLGRFNAPGTTPGSVGGAGVPGGIPGGAR